MGDQILELLEIVRNEIGLYRDLLEHARQKTALLAQGRLDALRESNKTDEVFNAKLRGLESEMARLCRDLRDALRIPHEGFTLVKLTQYLEPSLALELLAQADLFRNIVKRLKSVNQRNLRLMGHSLRYSAAMLALISNARGSYKPTGLFEPIPNIQPKYSQSG